MPLNPRKYEQYRAGQWVVFDMKNTANRLHGRFGQVKRISKGSVIVAVTNTQGLTNEHAKGTYRCDPQNILPLDEREKIIAKAEAAIFNRRLLR